MNKSLILILLLAFPTTILFGAIITVVHADPYIPEEHVNNEWYWNVDEDELIILEMEMILTDPNTLEESQE